MKKSILIISFIILNSCFAQAQNGYSEKGIASYYADKFNGRTTANGEKFNNSKMTAAHKTLPFGTIVKVTNVQNQKSVIVRINDRGPYAHGRIIDLSKKAATELGMLQTGLSEVLVEEVESVGKSEVSESDLHEDIEDSYVMSIWGTKRKAPAFGVQIASFESRDAAINFGKEAYNKGVKLPLIIVYKENNKTYYRVMAGDFDNIEDAEHYMTKLKKTGYKGFVKSYR